MAGLTPTWLKQIITEANGEVVDLKRVAGIGMLLQFSFMGIWSTVVNHQQPDPVGFGTGAMAILSGIGAAIGLGHKGETPASDDAGSSK